MRSFTFRARFAECASLPVPSSCFCVCDSDDAHIPDCNIFIFLHAANVTFLVNSLDYGPWTMSDDSTLGMSTQYFATSVVATRARMFMTRHGFNGKWQSGPTAGLKLTERLFCEHVLAYSPDPVRQLATYSDTGTNVNIV